MLGVTLSIVPECQVLGSLTATIAVMGFFMGTIDTVANISMLQLFGRDVAPFLQVRGRELQAYMTNTKSRFLLVWVDEFKWVYDRDK